MGKRMFYTKVSDLEDEQKIEVGMTISYPPGHNLYQTHAALTNYKSLHLVPNQLQMNLKKIIQAQAQREMNYH